MGLLLATIQAALADHHGERRTVALAEENVVASLGYIALIGVLSLTAALHAGWRVAQVGTLADTTSLQAALVAVRSCSYSRRRGSRSCRECGRVDRQRTRQNEPT